MTAEIIDGKEMAKTLRDELVAEVAALEAKHGVVPGLAAVLVSDDPVEFSYVTAKGRACGKIGVNFFPHVLPAQTSEATLLALVDQLNHRENVHGILVQLPLPGHIDLTRVCCALDPEKDIDGFHPVNVGRLVLDDERCLPPCTPAGIQAMIARSGTPTAGAQLVVVGRCRSIGKPLAIMMLQKKAAANATVTVCHARTRSVPTHTRRADILVVAARKVKAITADMVKPGATVIDAGANRIGVTKSNPGRLGGDVDFEAVKEVAAKISPVPGGVGPMTIAMLLKNTLRAAQRSAGSKGQRAR